MRGCQDAKKNTTPKKDLHPVHYNHKYASLKDFAERLSLVGKSLGTAKAYYRQMRLVSEHFGCNPKSLSLKSVGSYLVHLDVDRGLAPRTRRQATASCREFYAGMLGKDWKLWDVVCVRDSQKLPVVLDVGR